MSWGGVAQILSHIPFICAALVAFSFAFLDVGVVLTGMVITSLIYHVCDSYDKCVHTMNELGSADYIVAFIASLVLSLRIAHLRRMFSQSYLIICVIILINVYPRIYGSIGGAILGTLMVILPQIIRFLVFGYSSAYRQRLISTLVMLTTIASTLLILYPARPKESGYTVVHPLWHVVAGIGTLLLVLYAVCRVHE